MLLTTALALLITGCTQQTFTVQNKPAAVTREHHPSFLRFWNWARRKLSMQPKFVAAQKILETETQQTFVNGYRFYYFRHLYSAGSAIVYCSQ